ncbi:MAG TPA: hypothetical protein VIL03_01115 [Clostridia bacterium]|jgi:hypothetical protein
MKLLVFILKKVELQDEIFLRLAKAGFKGGTVLDGKGMANTLAHLGEDVPMFGGLRHIISEFTNYESKVMMLVLKENQLQTAKNIIKEVTGDLKAPNTGIMFVIDIEEVEGYKD